MGVSENVRRPNHKPELGVFSKKYPLLVERAKEYGFDIPTDAPWGDRIIVWRLPAIDKTESGLYLPENRNEPHVLGVLVAAGMKALDELESNGITIGHMVKWERFAGWEHDDATPEHKRGGRFLHLNARNILTSVDLKKGLETGKVNYQRGVDGRSQLQTRLLSAKKEKVLALANDPAATKAERATAKRLAAKMK